MYACNGILFNHESPRRGETFVTRKISRGLSRIALGIDKDLKIGNLEALRDWGHAKDYVEMQWLMLQQDKPKDYVIATGRQASVRDFIQLCLDKLEIGIEWKGSYENEIGVVTKCNEKFPAVKLGSEIIKVDKKYFRPAEVETLLGDPSLAEKDLGWIPKISLKEMVSEMVDSDIQEIKDILR